MNIKCVVLSVFAVTSVMATRMTYEEMANELMAVKDEDLEETFREFEEQDEWELRKALGEVAKKGECMLKAVRCLEVAKDSYPKERSNVSGLVHDTVYHVFYATWNNTEAFAKIVASFKPSAVKPLASIRFLILHRMDARGVLERVMNKSPELITGNLPRWLASHGFDQNSRDYEYYESARKQAFDYLVSLATESVFSEALAIVRKHEHYKVNSDICCCWSETSSPSDLINKLEYQLRVAQIRNILDRTSTFLPTALIRLIVDYSSPDLPAETPSAITE